MTSAEQWTAKCRELLAVTYTPEGVDLYMKARNRKLNGKTPRWLIMMGEGAEVFAEIERIEGGVLG